MLSTSNHQGDASYPPINNNAVPPSTPPSNPNIVHVLENSAPLSNPNLTSGSPGVPTANSLSCVITRQTNNSTATLPPENSSGNTGTSDRRASLNTSSRSTGTSDRGASLNTSSRSTGTSDRRASLDTSSNNVATNNTIHLTALLSMGEIGFGQQGK